MRRSSLKLWIVTSVALLLAASSAFAGPTPTPTEVEKSAADASRGKKVESKTVESEKAEPPEKKAEKTGNDASLRVLPSEKPELAP